MADRKPGRGERLVVRGRPRAIGAYAVPVQPGVAQTGPQAPPGAQRDGVLQAPLGTALVALGVLFRQCWVGRQWGQPVDGARARVVVRLLVEASLKSREQNARREAVLQAQPLPAAVDRDIHRITGAALALAAVVVKVEAAVAAIAAVVALCVTTKGKRHPVVGAQTLAHGMGHQVHVVAERLGQAYRASQAVHHHRQTPGLVVQVGARVDAARRGQHVPQQAEAWRAGLALPAAFDLQLQQRTAAQAGLGGQRQEAAVALAALELRVQPFQAGVQAPAQRAVGAGAVGQVHRQAQAVFLLPGQFGLAQALGGPLDHQIHQAPRRAGAGLQAAGAFQDLQGLLVALGDGGLCVDGQAVAPVVEAVVQREAAHGQLAPVARRVVGVGGAGVHAGQVANAGDARVLQLTHRDDGGRERRARQGHVAKARHAGGVAGAAAADGDGLSGRIGGGLGPGECGQGQRQRGGQARGGAGCAERRASGSGCHRDAF